MDESKLNTDAWWIAEHMKNISETEITDQDWDPDVRKGLTEATAHWVAALRYWSSLRAARLGWDMEPISSSLEARP